MAPKGKRTCSVCHQTFPREVIKIFSNKNYCPKCAEVKDKEIRERRALTDYIQERLNPETGDWPLIMKQVKQYKEEYGFKYTGMKATLRYMLDYAEEDIDLNLDNGIALLPFYYKRANEFFTQVYHLKGIPTDEIEEGLSVQEHHIVLNRSDLIAQNEEFWRKKKEKEQSEMFTLDDVEDDGLMVTDFSIKSRYDHLIKKWDEEELSKIDSEIESELGWTSNLKNRGSNPEKNIEDNSENDSGEDVVFLDADDIEDDGYDSTLDED